MTTTRTVQHYIRLPTVGDTPVPEGYGILHGPDYSQAAQGRPAMRPLQQVEDVTTWTGPERQDPLKAVIDAWVHATGATPRE